MKRETEAPTGFSPENWDGLRGEALAALDRWHNERPDDPGPGEDRLRRALGHRVPEAAFNAVVIELVREEKIARDASSLRLPGHRAAMTVEDLRPQTLPPPAPPWPRERCPSRH